MVSVNKEGYMVWFHQHRPLIKLARSVGDVDQVSQCIRVCNKSLRRQYNAQTSQLIHEVTLSIAHSNKWIESSVNTRNYVEAQYRV